MFATVGAGGAMAVGPSATAPGAGQATTVAAPSPTASPAPTPAHADCPSGKTASGAVASPAAANYTQAGSAAACAGSQPHQNLASQIAAAAKARIKAGTETNDRTRSAFAAKPKVPAKPAARVRPTVQPGAANPAGTTTFAIKGSVTRISGAKMEGIQVNVYTSAWDLAGYAYTDINGAYSINFVAGNYYIEFYQYESPNAHGFWSATGLQDGQAHAGTVSVTSGDVTADVVLPIVSISGTVTDGSSPLPGIAVTLLGDDNNSTDTDSDGQFSFDVLPGTYQLSFYDPNGVYGYGWWSATGFKYDASDASDIVVSNLDTTADIELPPAIYITGTVRSTNAAHTLLSDIDVEADTTSGDYVNDAPTDTDGTYSIVVAPGSYKIYFSDGSEVYASVYHTASGYTYDLAGAMVVVVTAADVVVNQSLPVAVHIKGKVTDNGGTALDGIEVYADSLTDYSYATTDATGNYSVVVSPGTYTLSFRDNDMLYAAGYYSTAGYTWNSSTASAVVVSTADVTGKNVKLPLAPHIQGKVTKTGGDAVTGERVVVDGDSFSTWEVNDPDGTFSIAVQPGSYTLYFVQDIMGDKADYARGYLGASGFVYFHKDAALITVATADVTGKNVVLPVPTFITGTVSDLASVALSGIDVSAQGNDESYGATTADDGTYWMDVAPNAAYTMVFDDSSDTYASGYWSAGDTFTYDPGSATQIPIASADGHASIKLPLAIHFTGKVVDTHGDPISDIRVLLGKSDTYQGSDGSAYTDTDGTYSLTAVPGDYLLSFEDDTSTYGNGYYSDSGFQYSSSDAGTVTLVDTDVALKDIALPDALLIEGKVTRSGGVGLSEVWVYADGPGSNDTTTGPGGSYAIAVAPGDYTLYFSDYADVYGSGYYSTAGFTYDLASASPVTVVAASVTGKNVVLPLAIHIKGKVTKAGGAGLGGLDVRATDGANGTDGWATTSADGTYSMAVGPGTYTLRFLGGTTYGTGYYSTAGFTYLVASATKVTVAAVDVTGKNVVLPLAVHIKGKVTKAGGAGLSGIYVDASSSSGYGSSETGLDGSYSVTVAPGSYTLSVTDETGTYGSGYYSATGFTYFYASATNVAVSSADVTGKNVTLPTAVHITGKVTKAGGGGGLKDIEIDAESSGYSNYAMTAADGTYAVAVAPGTYTLRLYPNGPYASGWYSGGGFVYTAASATPIVVAATEVTGKNVELPLALHIRGKVTNASNAPVADVQLVASSADRLYSGGTQTGSDGTYVMEVAPGSYKIWVRDTLHGNGAGYYSTGAFVYTEAAATAVPIVAADATGINVKMIPAAGPIYPASTYYAIAPRRVLDTRPGAGHMGLDGKFTAGTVRTFAVGGARYVGGGTYQAIPTWAVAVTGNLTIVGETTAGVVSLGPTATGPGDVTTPTSINFVKGDIRANNVTVGLATDGSLSAVFRSTTAGATTDLIFDITGYFMPDTTGPSFHALTPGRVLDTRPTVAGRTNIGLSGKFANQVVRTINVAGVVGLGWASAQVPSTATAITGNLTVTNATSGGFVSVGPTMVAVPSTSTANVVAGANVANGVTVALSGGRLQAVWDGAKGSSADLIFDVTGYFTPDATGLTYHAIAPFRPLNVNAAPFANRTPTILGLAGVGAIPADAAGISGNLTIMSPSTAGFAFISPDAVASPTSSTANTTAHVNVANGFDVSLSSGHVVLIWCGLTGSQTLFDLDVTGYWK
jgi:hypothetical protein